MFKNYITYQLALSFDRICCTLPIPIPFRNKLLRCSRCMIHHFSVAIHSKDPIEQSKSLFVALTYLRDCKEILDQAEIQEFDVRGRYEVLHGRFEQICLELSKAENGQLRMFG